MKTATAAARLLSCTVWAFALPQAQAACKAPTFGAFSGVERSQWQEWGVTGQRLVREKGNLFQSGIELTGQCEPLDWRLRWSQSQGERAYSGLTNHHSALQTHSDLRSQAIGVQLWLPVSQHWSIGGELNWRQIRRDIASQGAVLGYAERFRYTQAGIGLRYQTPLTPALRLSSHLIAGGGSGHNLVALPGFDSQKLPLGHQRYASLAIELAGGQPAFHPGWSWKVALTYRLEKNQEGEAKALYRNGRAVGSVMQPRFEQRHIGADLALSYLF